MSSPQDQCSESRPARATLQRGAVLGICAVALLVGAVAISRSLALRTLKPAISAWQVSRDGLVIHLSLANSTSRALGYCHHPFPVRFLTGRGWADGEIVNGFRSAVLDPGAVLSAEVLVVLPQERPMQFQVGTDFQARRPVPSWLGRFQGSSLSRPFRPILDPIIRSIAEVRPIRGAWSDAVTMDGQAWTRHE